MLAPPCLTRNVAFACAWSPLTLTESMVMSIMDMLTPRLFRTWSSTARRIKSESPVEADAPELAVGAAGTLEALGGVAADGVDWSLLLQPMVTTNANATAATAKRAIMRES